MTSTEEHTGWPFMIDQAARSAIPSGATPAAVVAILLNLAKEFLWADQFRSAASDDPVRADLIKVTRTLTAALTDLADQLERKAGNGTEAERLLWEWLKRSRGRGDRP